MVERPRQDAHALPGAQALTGRLLSPDDYLVGRDADAVTLGMAGVGYVLLELDEAVELGAALIRAARPSALNVPRRRRRRARAGA